MFFGGIFPLMKEGAKAKLPHWAGYWEWDDEKKTIMMHCRAEESDTGEEVLDIRETQRVEFTLANILSGKWIIADEKNCPKLGGEALMDFGDALHMVKKWNKKIARKGWNGKNQYIELAQRVSYMNADGEEVNVDHEALGNAALAFVGTSGVQLGWLASQADMLADDWYVVE